MHNKILWLFHSFGLLLLAIPPGFACDRHHYPTFTPPLTFDELWIYAAWFLIPLYLLTWRQSPRHVHSVLVSPNFLPYCIVVECFGFFSLANALLMWWLLVAIGNMRRLVAAANSLYRIRPSCKGFIFAMIGPMACVMHLGTILLMALMSAHPSQTSPNVLATLCFCGSVVFLSWLGSTLSTNALNRLEKHRRVKRDPMFVPIRLECFALIIICSWLLLGVIVGSIVGGMAGLFVKSCFLFKPMFPLAAHVVAAAIYLFFPLKRPSVSS